MPIRETTAEEAAELNAAIFLCAAHGYIVLDLTSLSDEECLEQIRNARQAYAEREAEKRKPCPQCRVLDGHKMDCSNARQRKREPH